MADKFSSEAHKRKLEELVATGVVKQSDFNKMQQATGHRKLPDRIKPKAPKGGRR